MAYIRDRVIVLKKEPFREQDRRYVMYGREHGLLVAVARGSSLKKAKQAGHLEPFSEVDVMVAKGRAFDALAVATLHAEFPRHASMKLGGIAVLGAFCDLVISLLRPGVADDRIFDLLCEVRNAAAAFPSEPSAERARFIHAGATLKLLDLLGYGPLVPGTKVPGTAQSLTLLKFLRRFPLTDALRITATTDALTIASAFVEDALRHTPLEKAPHGPLTIAALLTPAI